MATIQSRIRKKALEYLTEHSEGLRFSKLVDIIHNNNPEFNPNTIRGAVWDLDTTHPKKVYKPDRGLFRLTDYRQETDLEPEELIKEESTKTKSSIKEDDFYKPFSDWLVTELEECTKAIPLGGNIFKDKWGTPDVIGIRESKRSDIIEFPTEIVSVEIKTDSNGLITAFGQACAYKIFSHKSYIVVPKQSQYEDITRLDSLCRLFGIGLILFNNADIESPDFEIRARAIKHEPDMFFVNKNLKLIETKIF